MVGGEEDDPVRSLVCEMIFLDQEFVEVSYSLGCNHKMGDDCELDFRFLGFEKKRDAEEQEEEESEERSKFFHRVVILSC